MVAEATLDDGKTIMPRLKKAERRRQTLLELKLRPHVRISELAARFGVSTETVRRDFDALAEDGLVSRAHGGATSTDHGHYPGLDERAAARVVERERIGHAAAQLIAAGETIMIDSGSTTIEMARALAWVGTPCRVITNSIPVASVLAHAGIEVLLCPGEYKPSESAVIGVETLEFIARFHVDRAFIGASGLSLEGPSESVPGFAAIKRAMLGRAAKSHLLIDSEKFGRFGTAKVGAPNALSSIIVDRAPDGDLLAALEGAEVKIVIAGEDPSA